MIHSERRLKRRGLWSVPGKPPHDNHSLEVYLVIHICNDDPRGAHNVARESYRNCRLNKSVGDFRDVSGCCYGTPCEFRQSRTIDFAHFTTFGSSW